jgi:hypothetical protein
MYRTVGCHSHFGGMCYLHLQHDANYTQVGAEVIQGSKWVDCINMLHELCPIRRVKMGAERDPVPGQQDE